MKNAFYFMLKALFVVEIFSFFYDVLVQTKNNLIRKLWLIYKFMMTQTGPQMITIH